MSANQSTLQLPPIWVSYWMVFTTIIVLWDAGYCFNRPHSFPGGKLAWIWWPYNHAGYGLSDYMYGWPAYKAGDGFTNAQAFMNLIEAVLNVEFLYLRHFSPRTERHVSPATAGRPNYHAHAPVVGLASTVMTAAKTALYYLQEYYCGFCYTKQNTRVQFWTLFVLPNIWWVIMPTIVAVVLGQYISRALNREFADQLAYQEFLEEKTTSNGTAAASNGSSSASSPAEERPAVRSTPRRRVRKD